MLTRIGSKLRHLAGGASAPPPGPADRILGRLIPREEVIDRFDASYLDDLPEILREVHGVTEENAREHELWPELEALWALGARGVEAFSPRELPAVLVDEVGVDPRLHSPKQISKEDQRRFRYDRIANWQEAAGIRLREGRDGSRSARAAVNKLQIGLSHDQSKGSRSREFAALDRMETGDPWTPFIRGLRESRGVSAEEPVLTIGPRWLGEIEYFRSVLGLRGAVGLDLFSKDEGLIKVGDMHDMPFDSDMFGLVYQRNTFNKSYDIRGALRECVRVLRDGGFLISDDCYAYTDGVSPLARTNIKHNRQILRVLEPHVSEVEVLYDEETPTAPHTDWVERVGQLAVRIRK